MPRADDKSGQITGFHAHIYYDAETKDRAAILRTALEEGFDVELGRWHDRPVGPHPRWSYQVAFAPEALADVISWLMLNRRGLTVLVHPLTGDDLADHRDHPLWLGERLDLDLSALE